MSPIEPKEMSAVGSTFLERLLLVHRYRRTGVLEVQAHGVGTFVYFMHGVPVFAEEGSLHEALGRVLVRDGLISEAQYMDIITRMTDEVVDNETLRFGEMAVELGFLSLDQVNAALGEQVRQKVLRCFQWADAECDFKPITEALDEVPHYPLDVAPLVAHAVRRFYDYERTEAVLRGIRHTFPTVHGAALEVAARFKLKQNETKFVESINGRMSVDRILASSSLDPLHAAQLITALALNDVLDLNDQRQVNSVQMRAMNATSVAVKSNILATADPPPPPPVEPVKVEHRAEPKVRPGERPSVRPSMPPPVDVRKSQLRAESLFQRGKAALAQGLHAKAVKDLVKARELRSDAVEYNLCATWAEYRTAQTQPERDALKAHLDDLAVKAVREDNEMAYAHYVKAHLLLASGDEAGARRSFRAAVHFDSTIRDAEQQLRVLEARRRS